MSEFPSLHIKTRLCIVTFLVKEVVTFCVKSCYNLGKRCILRQTLNFALMLHFTSACYILRCNNNKRVQQRTLLHWVQFSITVYVQQSSPPLHSPPITNLSRCSAQPVISISTAGCSSCPGNQFVIEEGKRLASISDQYCLEGVNLSEAIKFP